MWESLDQVDEADWDGLSGTPNFHVRASILLKLFDKEP